MNYHFTVGALAMGTGLVENVFEIPHVSQTQVHQWRQH